MGHWRCLLACAAQRSSSTHKNAWENPQQSRAAAGARTAAGSLRRLVQNLLDGMNQENSLKITVLGDFHAVEMPLEDIEVSEGRVCIEELDERTKNGS